MQSTDKPEIASHLIAAAAILLVLFFRLTSAAIAGFLVYTLSLRLMTMLDRHGRSAYARRGALALVISGVTLVVLAALLGLWQFIKSQDGVAGLSAVLIDTLGRAHTSLPAWLNAYVPDSVEGARAALVELFNRHRADFSAAGMRTVKLFAHMLIGLVAGAMLAWGKFGDPETYRPLSRALLRRFSGLALAFQRVVFSQVQIALLNTVLTALYLEAVLPMAGVDLPFSKTLVGFTFVAGLIPIVGNLLSNSVIVLVSLGVSVDVAIASLVFLVLVHKLEYFANARIVGRNIEARAWEVILSMVFMETLFGLAGVVVAPIIYAYLKAELKQAGLVGRNPPAGPGPAGS